MYVYYVIFDIPVTLYIYILAAVRTESGNVDVCAPVTEVVNVPHTHPYPYMFVHIRVHEKHARRQPNEGSGRIPQNSASGFGALAGWSGCRTVPKGTCEHENWPTKALTEFRGILRKWFRGSGGQVSLQNGPEGHRSMFLNLFLGLPLRPHVAQDGFLWARSRFRAPKWQTQPP